MQKIRPLFLLAVLSAIAVTGCTNVRPVGQINGLDITRVTTRGVFSPSQTVLVFSSTNRPGSIDGYTSATGPGVLPAVAQAAATPFEGFMRRPDHVSVQQAGGGANATGGNANASGASANSTGNTSTGGGHVHNNTH